MTDCCGKALTIGEIARRLDHPIHQVQYIVRTRGLKPACRAGRIRVFTEGDVQFIASILRRIEAERDPLTQRR